MRTAIFGLAGCLLALTTNAATVQYEGTTNGLNVVAIEGQIVEGDATTFDSVIAPLTGRTVVFLKSPGGLVGEGLAIGARIRLRGFATAVAPKDTCASVCGLMWLAGTQRYLSESSRIGFHAAYRQDGTESGVANAVAGAYLGQLGLPIEAVVYLTSTPPEQVAWLHPSDAKRVGITYTLIPEEPSTTAPSPNFIDTSPPQSTQPSQPTELSRPTQPTRSPAEQQAIQLVLNYTAYWSQGGVDVEGRAQYYAPVVTFYGGGTTREKMMVEKRKFSARWPVRHYTVDQRSLLVQCESDGCSITGVLIWDCTSQERGEHSVGSANFAWRVVNRVIVSENGSVLTGHKETIGQQQAEQQAVTRPAYAQGRQARIDYEQWVNGLPNGEFKDGVLFWAEHRSDKPRTPTCVGPTPDWQAGCLASRSRLASSDIRRNSEKDFWYGWNSL